MSISSFLGLQLFDRMKSIPKVSCGALESSIFLRCVPVKGQQVTGALTGRALPYIASPAAASVAN